MRSLIITACVMLSLVMHTIAQTPTEMPTGKKFHIQSAMNFGRDNGGYWDIPGKPGAIQRGSNIQVWALDDGHDRMFTLHSSPEKGYYEIQIGNTSSSRVDIQGRATANGTSVKTWDSNRQTNQRFMFQHLGNGRFKVFDRNSGKALCLASRNNANGTNVHIWDNHNGAWMEWYLIDVQTKRPFIPGTTHTPSEVEGSISSNEVRLGAGEQMVLGKIGLFENGNVKYTFSVVRKANSSKEVYRRRNLPYQSNVLSGGGVMNIDQNPPEHDLYDYFVIFNGKRFGPYDRIVEMHHLESDIDKWISACGKFVSFAFQKGDKYFPVIANVEDTYPFRGPHASPVFDVKSGKNTRILRWSETDVRLKENDIFRIRGWHALRDLSYSSDGSRLLYVGIEKQGEHASLFINHEKVSGSLAVGPAGFIPNTNIHYFLNAEKLVVGSRNLDLPGPVHGRRWFVGDYMIIAPRVSDNNNLSKQTYIIMEYNYKTDELKNIEGFFDDVRIITAKGSSTPYYSTFTSNGDAVLLKQGGEIIQRVTKAQRGENYVNFAVSKNGDILAEYKDTKERAHVLLNGKVFDAVGYTEHSPRRVEFCEVSSKPIVDITTGRRSANDKKTRFIMGDKVLDFDYDSQTSIWHEIYRTTESDIYVIRREPLNGNRAVTRITILKNNQPLYTEPFTNIASFSLSCDGNRSALIANQTPRNFMGYIPENNVMHEKWELIIDGKAVDGNFGAPAWSKKKQKFLALKQEGNTIRLVEL
ncbi:RICIN domain-containing protein [Perlabentimonas gracilis]|uniref:RICIN domain-containing protein n=1 Tax=Perlabentimonas gracilis TaxID=2715279 RepID=UPI00140DB359|nr:RICIN domain-containing protein [Perlabentimonas gracilis]NHB67129.1 RICIN domain-containing protein [Perlabentimonas gracilis]